MSLWPKVARLSTAMALALALAACAPRAQNEQQYWDNHSKDMVELSSKYPGFKPLLAARQAKAKPQWDAAVAVADEKQKAEQMKAANGVFWDGVPSRLQEASLKLDGLEGAPNKLLALKLPKSKESERMGAVSKAQASAQEIRRALAGARPAAEADALKVLDDQISKLISAQGDADRALAALKKAKLRGGGAGLGGSAVVFRPGWRDVRARNWGSVRVRGWVMRELLRAPAELRTQAELDALVAADQGAKPPGWRLSPKAVETYLLGSNKPVGGVAITPKYVGDRAIVQVAIATLASDRALLLVGEPGTAKSWLSEHLAAAISGTSSLIVQGTAGTTEDQIKYGWNYALLLAEGPSRRALVPSPVLRAMEGGQLVRFEEVTRSAAEVQDALISILSEKQIAVPELDEIVSARRGFNVIATANSRDRGVNEMSAALKRRFNFVTVPVIEDLEQEVRVVTQREAELRADYQVGAAPPPEIAKMLVTMFQELRRGVTKDGRTKVRAPDAVLSTAEAISVLFQGGILAQSFGGGHTGVDEVARALVGAVTKDGNDDVKVLREYLETVAKHRPAPWKDLHERAKARLSK
ncbi:MAG TPA: AAA family ATPase [Polyangiaceae bacterium]|nr:AAA family ATPase [Polyangiaceae bacterium]